MRIVLTRLDRVGDLILSTPAITSVRRSWPDAHVTLACSRHNAVVVDGNTDVDDVIAIPDHASPAALGRTLRGDCDLAIALAPSARDFALVGATRAPVRVGYTYVRRWFARATAGFALTRLGISEADPELCERDPSRVVRHEVDQVNELVLLAGGTRVSRDLVVSITDADRAAVAHVPVGALALHLGPRWFTEGSSYASVVELARQLRELGAALVVTHGADTAEEAARLRTEGVADLVIGGMTFAQWAAVFEKSRLVVTVDTGATHVASAVRRPTVVLFEHRYFQLNSQEWSPYRVPAACLRKPATSDPAALAASRAAIVSAARELLGATIQVR